MTLDTERKGLHFFYMDRTGLDFFFFFSSPQRGMRLADVNFHMERTRLLKKSKLNLTSSQDSSRWGGEAEQLRVKMSRIFRSLSAMAHSGCDKTYKATLRL